MDSEKRKVKNEKLRITSYELRLQPDFIARKGAN